MKFGGNARRLLAERKFTYLRDRRMNGTSLQSHVAAMIERLRADRGWTKARLAEEADLAPESVSQILRGVRPFSFDMAERIFRALEE